MTTFTATQARQSLFALVKKSIKGHVPVKITSKSGDVVMMSNDDYESLVETLELLSTPQVLKGVSEAKSDIKAGRTKSLKEVFGK
jgi:antitoxin YefM